MSRKHLLAGFIAILVPLAAVLPIGSSAAAGDSFAAAANLAPAADTTFYVSPRGNDQGSGSHANPFRTIEQAQAAARRAAATGADVVVNVREGDYGLSKPLTFDASDSGQGESRVTYQAFGYGTNKQENVTLSGGKPVTGWTLFDKKLNIWVADVGHAVSRNFFVNDHRATRASIPNTVKMHQTPVGYADESFSATTWINAPEVEMVWHRTTVNWNEPRCGVDQVLANVIVVEQPCFRRVLAMNQFGNSTDMYPTSFENSRSFLKDPGTFVTETAVAGKHKIYYIPREGESMATTPAVMPVLETLIEANGTPTEPVENISIRGFTLRHTTWMQPSTPEGFPHFIGELWEAGDTMVFPLVASDKMRAVPGSVRLLNANGFKIEDNRFLQLGAGGLEIVGDRNHVIGNEFADLSGGGVIIGHALPLPGDTNAGNVISNNWIHNIGIDYLGGTGVTAFSTTNTVISHNQINDVRDRGIWVVSTCRMRQLTPVIEALPTPDGAPACNFWGVSIDGSTSPTVSNNLLFDLMTEGGDGGGIYTVGLMGTSYENGGVISGNVVRDTNSNTKVVNDVLGTPIDIALYADGGSEWATWKDNVAFNNDYSAGGAHTPVIARVNEIKFLNNFWVDESLFWPWGPGDNITEEGTTHLDRADPAAECAANPKCAQIVANAGLTTDYRDLLLNR